MERLKEVLAFVNNKGGVAKTTTVQNTAAGILRSHPEYRILCVDLDPQGNLSSLLGWNDKQKQFAVSETVYNAMLDGYNNRLPVYKSKAGLYYGPSSPALARIEPDLFRQMNPKLVLNQLLGNGLKFMDEDNAANGSVIEEFDYVLIDCAPALSELTFNALGSATGVIIPMGLDALSVSGLPPMLKAVSMVKAQLNHGLVLKGVLVTKANERTNLAKSILECIREEDYGHLYPRIRECVKIKESQAMYQDIFDYAPDCTAAADYADFVNELLTQQNY